MSVPTRSTQPRNWFRRHLRATVLTISVPVALVGFFGWNYIAVSHQRTLDAELIWAAKFGRLADLEAWLSRGASPNARDSEEDANPNSVWRWVTSKLHASAPPSAPSPSVLFIAAGSKKDAFEMVRLLVERGAEVRASKGGEGPLLAAIEGGDQRAIDYLLQHGARVTDAPSGLVWAARGGNYTTAVYFVEHGADVNGCDSSFTPLMGAVLADKPDLVKFLIDRGADVRASSVMGTALSMAEGHPTIKRMLKKAGATD